MVVMSLHLVIADGFAPSSFLRAKLTFCSGYQLISLVFTSRVHVPPFFNCFSSKFWWEENEFTQRSDSLSEVSQRRERLDFRIHLPIQQGLFDKHVHGVEQQIGLGSVRSQGVDHDALDQARLPQRLHEVDKLLGQPERHELRHGEEL